MAPPTKSKEASQMQPSTSREARSDRFVRPLGSARRNTRSRTPTPANPHPGHAHEGASVNQALRDRDSQRLAMKPAMDAVQTRLSSNMTAPTADRLRNCSTSSSFSSPSPYTRSRSSQSSHSQSHPDRRPWFPYPSSAKDSTDKHRSPSNRRESDLSTDSVSSASTSSASSYNSEDINTRLNHGRRAQSAEPDQASSAASRGRPLRGRTPPRLGSGHKYTSLAESHVAEESDPTSSSDDEKERAHFKSVLKAIDAYLSHSLAANNARRRSFYSLPRSHRLLLSSLGSTIPGPLLSTDLAEGEDHAPLLAAGRGFKARLDEIDDRIRRNADVLNQILDDSRGFLGEEKEEALEEFNAEEPAKNDTNVADSGTILDEDKGSLADPVQADVLQDESMAARSAIDEKISQETGQRSISKASQATSKERPHYARVPDRDLDKVRSAIKQFVRDWSVEGSAEREAAYDPILDALEDAFKSVSSAQRSQLRVLVPGAGLGRLAFEIAWLGFSCQGNEFSFYMLLASHFILNKTASINQHTIYPYIHSSSNWRTASDMLRPIQIPDINPSDLPSHVDFSMVAGEFIEVYSKEQEKEAWDAVATCFFIDTAHNLTRYLEVINQILVMGGVWVNAGPLLWHYEGAVSGDLSIELTLDEVINLIELMGFFIESRRTLEPQCYTGNRDSMLMYRYSPEFWVARKVRNVTPAKVI